jgi:hypothetical protein
MPLGDLKTAVFAGFKRRHGVPAHFAAACGALARRVSGSCYPRPFFYEHEIAQTAANTLK